MAEFPALPLFTDSYLGDTKHLSTLQHGAYMLMLMVAWRATDCSLPNDDTYLARITGLDRRTWNANKGTLLAFWKLNHEQKWEQGRLKDERNYVAGVSLKNAGNAKARWAKNDDQRQHPATPGQKQRSMGYKKDDAEMACKNVGQLFNNFAGGPPRNRPEDNDVGDATALPNACQNDAPTPTPTKEPLIPPLFEQFWTLFPKSRIGSKDKALRAWMAASRRATAEQILSACTYYAKSDEVARGFAKGAAAWLNDDRWNVDYRPVRTGPKEVLG